MDVHLQEDWEHFEKTGAAKGSFTWHVPNFVHYLSTDTHKDNLTSDEVEIGGCIWSLTITSGGPEGRQGISVFISCNCKHLPPQILANVNASITLVNRRISEASIAKAFRHGFSDQNPECGFSNFCDRDVLAAAKNSYMPDGSAQFRAELEVQIEEAASFSSTWTQLGVGYEGLRQWLASKARRGRRRARLFTPDEASAAKARKVERVVVFRFTGPVASLLQLSATAARVLEKAGMTPRLYNASDDAHEPQTVTASLAAPASVFEQLTVLKELLQELPNQAEFAVVQDDLPFSQWLLVELLACAVEVQIHGEDLETYLQRNNPATTTELLVAADFYGYRNGLEGFCNAVSTSLKAMQSHDVPVTEQHQGVIEDLDKMSAALLTRIIEDSQQAVRLQLNPPALATWFQGQSEFAVDLHDIRLDCAELASVLEALPLMPQLADVRLDCSHLDASTGYRLLTRGFHSVVKKAVRLRKLQLVVPGARSPPAEAARNDHYKAATKGLISLMTVLRSTLSELDVVADDKRYCIACEQAGSPTIVSHGRCCPCCNTPSTMTDATLVDALRKQARAMPYLAVLRFHGFEVDF